MASATGPAAPSQEHLLPKIRHAAIYPTGKSIHPAEA
jgi:hypothetical protein